MTTANATCPLDISPRTLAAWRDGALSTDEAARIAAHVSGCVACRREIALYESLDATLRRQPVLESDGRLWRAVRADISRHRRPRNTHRAMRRVIGASSAVAAVLLLTLGFAQLFRVRGNNIFRPAATATVQCTPVSPPTAVRGTPLAWQSGSLPVACINFGNQATDLIPFAVASTDGATAYACYTTSDNTGSQVAMYRTSDRARHWSRLAQLPLSHFQNGHCQTEVDALDSNRVLVAVTGINSENHQVEQRYELTEDGGATWATLATSDGLYGLTTWNGRSYALHDLVTGQQSNGGPPNLVRRLSVSTDHLQSWHVIDQNLVGNTQEVEQFWMTSDGEILAKIRPRNAAGSAYWISRDGGTHWERFAFPARAGSAPYQIIIAPPSPTPGPLRVCAGYAPINGEVIGHMICTFDGGHTWTELESLCAQTPCEPPDINPAAGALTPDNSVIVEALALGSKDQNHYGLYRLSPDSGQWQYLGPLTGIGSFFYAPLSDGGGVLWQYTGSTSNGGNLSGDIGPDIEGDKTLPPVLATATFP